MPLRLTSLPFLHRISSLSALQLFQLLRYGALVLVGVFFAKLKISLTDIGRFETFILITGMLSFFWVSGIINSLMSLFPKQPLTEQDKLLSDTFIHMLFWGVLTSLGLAGAQMFAKQKPEWLPEQSLLFLCSLYLIVSGPAFIGEYILFLKDKKKQLLAYASFSSLLTIFSAILPIFLWHNIIFSIYGVLLTAVIRFAVAIILLTYHAKFSFNIKTQLQLSALSLPIMLSLLLSGSAEYIDGSIVKSRFDNMSFAVYRYGAKELPVLLILANTLSTAMIPSLSKNLNTGLGDLKQKSLKLMHFGFPITIALMFFSPLIYRFVFSEQFIYSSTIFNIYLLLIIPRMLFPQTILTSQGKTGYLLASSLIEVIVNVASSLWLVGKMGLPGIALGSLIAYSVDKMFLVSVNYFVNKIPLSAYLKRSTFCMYTLLCCITFGLAYIWPLKFM